MRRWKAMVLAAAMLACSRTDDDRLGVEDTRMDDERDVAAPAPDNTGINKRDRAETVTPMDQGGSDADLSVTRRIREAIVADDSLSIGAKNIKIMTIDGRVTLRGPVESAAEKQTIAGTARSIAGAGKVDDQLEIAN